MMTFSMFLASPLSKMLESLIASMATRTISVLSEGRRYFAKVCGRKEGREAVSHRVPWGCCFAGQCEQPWPEMPGSGGGSACRRAGSRGCSHCTGEDEKRGSSG